MFSRSHADPPAQLQGDMTGQHVPAVANGNSLEVLSLVCHPSAHLVNALMSQRDVLPERHATESYTV